MSRSIVLCALAASLWSGAAAAQENIWNEQPGDIVVTRDVPRQNAVLVGEPGRPTIVNPKTEILGAIRFSVDSGFLDDPLSDLEAEAVRATRLPGMGSPEAAPGSIVARDMDSAFHAGFGLGHERGNTVGGSVSGSVGAATGQIQGLLSDALGRGR